MNFQIHLLIMTHENDRLNKAPKNSIEMHEGTKPMNDPKDTFCQFSMKRKEISAANGEIEKRQKKNNDMFNKMY